MKKHTKTYQDRLLYYIGEDRRGNYTYLVNREHANESLYKIQYFDLKDRLLVEKELDDIIDLGKKRSVDSFRYVFPVTPLTDKEIEDILENAHILFAFQNYLSLDDVDDAVKNDIRQNKIPQTLLRLYETLTPNFLQRGQTYYTHNNYYDIDGENVYTVLVEDIFRDDLCNTRSERGNFGQIPAERLFETEEKAIECFRKMVHDHVTNDENDLRTLVEIAEYLADPYNMSLITSAERLIIAYRRLKEMNWIDEIPERHRLENINI